MDPFERVGDSLRMAFEAKDAEIERLRAALIQVRGFAAIMAPNNWRDCKLYIEQQRLVLGTETSTGK